MWATPWRSSCRWPHPGSAAGLVLGVPKLLALAALRVYQSTLGPSLPAACRFAPTCSQYAYTAVERYGVLRGGWLVARRLGRCQPWGGSGYDPVP